MSWDYGGETWNISSCGRPQERKLLVRARMTYHLGLGPHWKGGHPGSEHEQATFLYQFTVVTVDLMFALSDTYGEVISGRNVV
jgi:hypothetical protein